MGTSTGYEAPTTPDWSDLKGQVTRAARNGSASSTAANDALRGFIQTSGGAHNISRGGGAIGVGRSAQNTAQGMAGFISTVGSERGFIQTSGGAHNISRGGGAIGVGRSAQNTAQGMAGFISTVGSDGLQQALNSYGLSEFVGKSAGEIIPALVDKLGGPASTINDSDARNALSKVMDELLGDLKTPEQVEDALEQVMAGEALEGLLSTFFGYYLYEQFCRVFYERLVNRVGRSNTDSYLNSIFDTIKSSLALKASGRDLSQVDWGGPEGQNITDTILQDTFEIFGG